MGRIKDGKPRSLPPTKSPYDIKGTDKCPNCYGTGTVAVGPWGARPPKGKCPECDGTGKRLDGEIN